MRHRDTVRKKAAVRREITEDKTCSGNGSLLNGKREFVESQKDVFKDRDLEHDKRQSYLNG